jgi:hypothetical protein
MVQWMRTGAGINRSSNDWAQRAAPQFIHCSARKRAHMGRKTARSPDIWAVTRTDPPWNVIRTLTAPFGLIVLAWRRGLGFDRSAQDNNRWMICHCALSRRRASDLEIPIQNVYLKARPQRTVRDDASLPSHQEYSSAARGKHPMACGPWSANRFNQKSTELPHQQIWGQRPFYHLKSDGPWAELGGWAWIGGSLLRARRPSPSAAGSRQ